jgi:hypothetical protein
MAATTKMAVLIDLNGKVLAAQLAKSKAATDGNDPPSTAELIATDGQRVLSVEVPIEVASLTGPSLRAFFSQVRMTSPVDVELPKFKVVQKGKGKQP